MRTLKLYGTGAATANAVAQVTIPTSTTLKGVQWAIAIDQVADNSHLGLELSKAATSQIATNGALDPFWEFRHYCNLVTSGMYGGSQNGYAPLKVSCRQGEIVYLHALVTTTTYYAEFILWY